MMLAIWGREKVIDFCLINAFKYRMRLGLKSCNVEDDLAKELWYLKKAEELKSDL